MKKHQWYIIKVRGGKEEKIKLLIEEAIEKAGLQEYYTEIKVPYEKVPVKRKGKKEERKRYMAFLFICTNLTGRLQEIISLVEGVHGFLGETGLPSQDPAPLQQSEIDTMFSRVEEKQSATTAQKTFKKGDIVTIIDPESSLLNFSGEVLLVPKDGKTLQISLNVFGGQHQATVTLAPDQVEKAANNQ